MTEAFVGSPSADGQPAADNGPRSRISEVMAPNVERRLSRLPRLIRSALGLVWRASRRDFAICAAAQLLSGILLGGQLLVARAILERLLDGGEDLEFVQLLAPLAVLAVFTLIATATNLVRTELQRLLGEQLARWSSSEVIDVASGVALIDFEDPAFHDRLQRAHLNAAARPLQMVTGVLGILSAGFAIAGVAIALLLIEPVVLGAAVAALAPTWLATIPAGKAAHAFASEQTERDRRRQYLFRVLSQKAEAAELRAFGLVPYLRGVYDRLYDQRLTALRQLVRRRLVLGLVGGLFAALLATAAIALLAWFVTSGRMSLDEAGVAGGAVVLIGQRARALLSSSNGLYESSLFIEDFTGFVELREHLDAARPSGSPPPGFETLAVQGVDFTYPSRSEPALIDVSLRVNRGEVVALVGENGSGKTTLAKLLAGLYTPTTGSVSWDSVDLAGCDPRQVRESITVLFQDFARYNLTARENIGVGRPARVDEHDAIVAAARAAGIDGALAGLPRGLDSWLGPEFAGGSDLSVGQWQRLALARAFFRDAPFIILDEPTAALDPRAEAQVFESIRSLFRDRSVLLVSHRFSSVRSADRIYVLEGGRITASGSHDDLVGAGGLYAELYELQAAAYLRGPDARSTTPGDTF